jgi:HD domain
VNTLDGYAATLAAPHAGAGWARVLPDTALTRDAADLLARHVPLPVQRHSMRVFLLGRAYARAHPVRYDEELLFVAAALHDLGLAPDLARSGTPFTRRGAELAAGLLREHAPGDQRIAGLAAAVRLHMRWVPAWRVSAETGLLQVGAWADVIGGHGLRRYRREVRALLPAAGFTGCFYPALLRANRGRAALRLLADVFGRPPG